MAILTARAKEIFLDALEIQSLDDRQGFIDRQCDGVAALRDEVEDLLGHHDQVGSFLSSGLRERDETIVFEDSKDGSANMIIGSYKLLEQLGEGGFGTVYFAEQSQPVRRKVAIKILKPGMDSRQVVARFEAERQALALMDHPNIARVFDGGTTSTGRPYFVMELVRGVPITEYCDEQKLTPARRLELFTQVCEAVQHAHQKGIIHRDIKPTNVLVSRHDSTAVVKVIDFGVAKALGQELTDKTLFTGAAQMIGTPLYMSPEQAGMSDLDVDTRSDIYSLGVLLYELLTGTTPFQIERFKSAGYDEIRRIIRDEEPPRPSTRLSTLGLAAETVSMNRGTANVKLTRLIRGELDWVVMKALEKDRNRRYTSAAEFAADIRRYMVNEPVLACPPSAGYRLRKFVTRNRRGLVTAAVLGASLLVAIGAVAGCIRWAALNRATHQSRTEEQVNSILDEVDSQVKAQNWSEALTALKRAEAIAADSQAESATLLRCREQYKNLEFLDRLDQLRLQRITSNVEQFDFDWADRVYAREFLGYGVDIEACSVVESIDRLKARPKFSIPLASALDDWVVVKRNRSSDVTSDWNRLVAIARGIDTDPLRDQLRRSGEHSAFRTKQELQQLAESIDLRAQHPSTLILLARTLRMAGLDSSSLQVLRDAQSANPGDFRLNYALGKALMQQEDYEQAVRFITAAIAIRPRLTFAHNDLGTVLVELKKRDEAIVAFRKAIELEPNSPIAYKNLGAFLHSQNIWEEATDCYRKIIDIEPKNAKAFFHHAVILKKQYKWDEAFDSFKKAIELDPKNELIYCSRAESYVALGEWAKAAKDFERILEINPNNYDAWRLASYTFIGAGDDAGYRRTCRGLIERFGKTIDPVIAERTAKVCLLTPDAVTDFSHVERLAQIAVTGTEKHKFYQFFKLAKALSENRAGRHAEAIRWLDQFQPSVDRSWDIDAIAFAALAMAQYRIGRTNEANASFALAKTIVADKMPVPSKGQLFEGNWHDWIHAQILIHEVEDLLMKHDGLQK